MRQTVLEITQAILSSMDSDEVNSISDSTEAYQVALLLRGVFYDCCLDLKLETHESLFELNPSGDLTKPCIMHVPAYVNKILWVKYNNQLSSETEPNFKNVCPMRFLDFFERQKYLTNTSNVGTMSIVSSAEEHEIQYVNDKMPEYYAPLFNNMLVFDSYDASEDAVLQKSKTMCGGLVYPTFDLTDNFYPPLDPSQFPYFVNRAKARAFIEIKQVQNVDAERQARRQLNFSQDSGKRLSDGESALQKQHRNTGYGRNR